MLAPARLRQGLSSAFSLVEMLVVLAIISILSALSIYSIQGLLSSNSISGAGEHLQEVLSLARQSAISRCRPVELRVYKQTSGNDFNGYQLVLYNSDGSVDRRLTKAQFLPTGTVISGTTPSLATPTTALLGVNPFGLSSTPPLLTEATDGTITSGLSYVSVLFNASGGLKDVSASSSYYYYLLVVPQHGTVTNVNAANKVVLTVDPISGITQYSRP